MAKDRKEQKGASKEFSHNPFKGLKLAQPKPSAPAPARPAPAPPPAPRKPTAEEDEAALFLEAVGEVERVRDPRGFVPPPPPKQTQLVDEEAEAFARLAELVSGEGQFELSAGDALIEGVAPGVDRRLLQNLRRGDYPVQETLDLHGMTRAEAKVAVEDFLAQSRRAGRRCVRIVHGRGLNSTDQLPVLKEQLKSWLDGGRFGRAVLAFASARPQDGGAGALYVLLRR